MLFGKLSAFQRPLSCSFRHMGTISSKRTTFDGRRKPHLRIDRSKNLQQAKIITQKLELEKYDIIIEASEEFVKCLYPNDVLNIRLRNSRVYQNSHLQALGWNIMRFKMQEMFLGVFRTSSMDINGHDFNYPDKLFQLQAWKRKPHFCIRKLLQKLNLFRIARVPMPQSALPYRIHSVFDERCFFAIVGYLALVNNNLAFERFMDEHIIRKLVQLIILK